MEEVLELRINYEYAHLLFGKSEGKNIDDFIKIVQLTKDDPRYLQIPIIEKQINDQYDELFFSGWQIKRTYSKKELLSASLFQILIKSEFEPCGEECGTVYDNTSACPICGANAKQIGPLFLHKGSIPKKDISRTISGEIVVSDRFANIMQEAKIKGMAIEPVVFEKGISNCFQLKSTAQEVDLTPNTIAGVDPFNLSEYGEAVDYILGDNIAVKHEKEIYKCPNGHTIGLNLLSEPYVESRQTLENYDLFFTRQKVGVLRGYLRPNPILLCSPLFRTIALKNKLTGFGFEVAHIE